MTERPVEQLFSASIFIELGDGNKALFWTDRWVQGKSLLNIAPCLCNAVGSTIKKHRTVAQALQGDLWIQDITGALTVQVILEYLRVRDITRETQLSQGRANAICWKWTSDKIFSTSSAYKTFFIGQQSVVGAKLLHKSRAPAKCKFFIWLVLHDRCWIAHRRKRHGLQDDDSCVLCNQLPKTIDHLLISCPFSREIWFKIMRRLGWETAAPTNHTFVFADWWTGARKNIRKEARKCFDSVVICVCWLRWKERNARTFDRQVNTIDDLLCRTADDILLWFHAGLKHLDLVVVALGRLTGHAFING